MKTLCISGVNSVELSYIEAIFVQAGMSLPRPAQRDEALTISRWHSQIQSRIDEIAQEQCPVELGRVWEQLASDLFVANLDRPVWGWSSVQSLALLDFWQVFDPQVRFVLVASSAQRFVANALESAEAMPVIKVLLERWSAQHLQMLQFYHRFPQKTVLVDIDHCIDNPAGLIKACEQSWQLGLSKVHFPSEPAPVFSTMSRFLADSLSQADKQWLSLQNEISSSATPIGTRWKKPSHVNIEDAIRAYRDDKQQAIEPGVSTKGLEQLRAAQSALTDERTKAQELNAQLIDARTLREQSTAQLKDTQEQLKDTQEQLKDTQEEGELLLLQLHQVQEELENYFQKYQDSKQELEATDMRWRRMLQRVPDYFDVEYVEVQIIEGVGTETLRWRLIGFEAAGRKLPELELISFIVDGVAVLELPRRMGNHSIIKRWPAVAASDDALIVTWIGDAKTDDKYVEALQQLGRSDWDLIQVIIAALITSLNTPDMLKRGDGVVLENTPQALETLRSKLSEITSVFRFDELTLIRAQVNPDYEHLWFGFKNVAIGNKRLIDFDFRISCANVLPNLFGRYPKLEFSERSGRAAIAEWFDESHDDFGAKLELRFVLPETMDMDVWERLSVADHEFIKTLVEQIPTFLSELQMSGVKLKRGWRDWDQLVFDVHHILKGCAERLRLTAIALARPKGSSSRAKRAVRS